jgi:cytochrome c-type biogenesis protein CcmH/NrfG
MPNQTESAPSPQAASTWPARQVYSMSAVCLLLGLAIGYFFQGSQPDSGRNVEAVGIQSSATGPAAGPSAMPTIEQMKHMADMQAQSLLAQLKSEPNNAALLIQVGDIYKSAHQFKEAAGYYEKSLVSDPKNVAIRTDMASCLHYAGDIDGALAQLELALKYDPKDANALFNLGMVKWKGKKDAKGALEAWQQLLKTNPGLDAQKRATVNKLVADAKRQAAAN